MFGFLNVNKPSGMTSHDVISVLRKITKIRQIGHAGTLDPLAEGVLPVAIGKASRLIEYLNEDKAYIASVQFGKISDTYDTEGAISEFSDKKISEEEIVSALKFFDKEIEQVPPAYSAVHYKGKRLYELARNGEIPDDIPKRKVYIYKSQLLAFNESERTAKILIECSKGTYIRSIVNDLGMMLDTGAIMDGLTRTAAGAFCIESAISLDLLKDADTVQKNLINPLDVLPFNCYNLSENEYQKIKHGQSLKCNKAEGMLALTYKSGISAVGELREGLLKVKKVFEQ